MELQPPPLVWLQWARSLHISMKKKKIKNSLSHSFASSAYICGAPAVLTVWRDKGEGSNACSLLDFNCSLLDGRTQAERFIPSQRKEGWKQTKILMHAVQKTISLKPYCRERPESSDSISTKHHVTLWYWKCQQLHYYTHNDGTYGPQMEEKNYKNVLF